MRELKFSPLFIKEASGTIELVELQVKKMKAVSLSH